MPRYNKKNRHIQMTYRELYKHEYVKQKQKIQRSVSEFGVNFLQGKYKAKIVLVLSAILVFIGLGVCGIYLTSSVKTLETQRNIIIANLSREHEIAKYERNIVISAEPVIKAQKAATEISVIQNKYIISVLEDSETISDIDRELEYANYLRDEYDCTAWINLRDRETLKSVFGAGDFYWVGYADNTLKTHTVNSIPVFFILYDSEYPVQIIEYAYDIASNTLRNRKDWG